MVSIGNNNYDKYEIKQDKTKVYRNPNIGLNTDFEIIGTYDRGTLDSKDNLFFYKTPLKKGLTSLEAEKFAKENKGSEIIVKEEDGTYSVYKIETSEKGKEILNKDFENIGVIEITKDVLNIVGGKKAYISTSDNTLRTFDKASFSLDFLEDDFVSVDLNLNLEDIDGIDTSSKKDIRGSLDGSITIDKDLIKFALQNAENETGVDFDLETDVKNNQYIIKAYYKGISIGNLAISPTSTGELKLNVGGFIANAKYILGGATFGLTGVIMASQIDVGKIVESIANNFAKDMGFKVKSKSDTEYILQPDLKSNALLKEINLNKDSKIKIEEINLNPTDLKMSLDQYGNLNLNIKKAEVIASTNPDGNLATIDKEGSDYININLKGELKNDFNAKLNTTINLKVNVTEQEKELIKEEIKKYSNNELSISGQLELKDIKIEANLEKEKVNRIELKDGYFEGKNLNIDNNGTKININSATGKLKLLNEGDNTILSADNTQINASIKTSEVDFKINNLSLSGNFIYNKNKPNEVIFDADKNKGISFTGNIFLNKENNIGINRLALRDSSLKIDFESNTLNITPKSTEGNISATSINLTKTSNIQGLNMNGTLNVDLNKGYFNLNAKNLKLSANLDDLKITYLNGSGNINYNGNNFSIKNANIVSKMKVGDFEIEKISGQGDVTVSSSGTLEFANTKDLEVETNIGLKAKGNLSISFDKEKNLYKILSTNEPVEINFKSKDGLTVIKNVRFEGKAEFNDNTKELVFSTYPNKSLQINNSIVDGAILKETNLSNASLKFNTKTSNFTISPLPDSKSFTFNSNINGINIKNLESTSHINYDAKNNIISWDKDIKLSLPDKNIEYIKCSGQNSLKYEENGNIVLSANGSSISGKFGDIEIQNLKLNGQVVYDTKNKIISIKGNSNEEFKIEGKINGKNVSILSSGTFSMKDLNENIEFTGENIKINGVLDGFSIESSQGTGGKLVISKDFSKIDLKELRCNISIEGINLNNKEGLISFSENGLDIDLSGNINLKKEQLFSLLDKISKNDLLEENIRNIVKQSIDIMNQHLNKFSESSIAYDKFSIKTDKDFNLSIDFQTNAKINQVEAKVVLDENQKNKKESILHIGDINISTNGNYNNQNISINNGQIKFNFNEELRKEVADMVKKELEKNGFKDVKLEISPNGDVNVSDATYVIKKGIFGKIVKNVKMKIHVNINVENNKVNINLDRLNIKNIFLEAIKDVVGGKNITINEIEKSLESTGIDVERNSRSQITLDLNSILKKYFDNNLNLKNAQITNDGNVLIEYEYNTRK